MKKNNFFNPKVTIVIPVYNGENFMKDAIDSALAQTYNNIEIIVVNDGSTDNTEKIALSYGSKIKYVKKENGGVSTALNVALKQMTGNYFSWLSHDDLYKPDKIKKEIEALEVLDNKETIIACNVDFVDTSLKLIKKTSIPRNAQKSIKSFLALDQSIGLNGCSLLISKKLFDKYGYFNESLRITQDYDMWARFSQTEEFFCITDNLVLSRCHKKQVGNTSPLVHQEVDNLHSQLIKLITAQELLEYTDNCIDKCTEFFNNFMKHNYKKSAIEILLKYVFILLENNQRQKALDYLNNNIFKTSFSNEVLFKSLSSDNKVKLVFHNTVWIKGGVERVLSTLFKELSIKYDIIFITADNNETQLGYEIPNNISIIKISHSLKQNIDIAIGVICRLVNANIFIGNSNLDELFLPTYKLLYSFNIKTIACNHYDYFLPYEENWLASLEKIRIPYYKYVNYVTWSTKSSYNEYSKHCSNGIYMPNPNTFDENFEKSAFSYTILCVGRFTEPKKRLDLSLRSFKKVLDKIPNAKLIVVGPYDLNSIYTYHKRIKLKNLIKKLKIPKENLSFVGECNNLIPYYKKADILMLTSESEGFGMVLTEAASFGLPSISFNINGVSDIIENGYSGYLVPKFDIDEMAKLTTEFLNDENLKRNFSQQALKKSEQFKKEIIVEKWEKLISEVLNSNNNIVFFTKEEERVLTNYENKIMNKGSILNQLNYHLKTFGFKKTVIKIYYKIFK